MMASVGCGAESGQGSCNPVGFEAFSVTVMNGSDGSGQCTTVISARGPGYDGALQCSAATGSDTCSCDDPRMTRAGTYQVTATRSDGMHFEKTVTVPSGTCGPVTQHVTFEFP